MPFTTPQFTDRDARLALPPRFANSAVLIEEVSDTELRIRKAAMPPEDEVSFTEECRPRLSEADGDFVLALLASPPMPNAELRRAAAESGSGHE